jgi:hypothetical protein
MYWMWSGEVHGGRGRDKGKRCENGAERRKEVRSGKVPRWR